MVLDLFLAYIINNVKAFDIIPWIKYSFKYKSLDRKRYFYQYKSEIIRQIQPLTARLRTGETESPTWASTTSIIHLTIASSLAKGKHGKNTIMLQRDKGMQNQA